MIKIKKIKPMFTALVTTMNKYKEDTIVGGLINPSKGKGSLMEYQTVLSVGSSVKDIKVGDLVCIDPSRFAIKKHKEGSLKDGVITDNPVITYNFDVVEMDGQQCLLLQDRDIDFIIEEYEEITDKSSNIIQPEEKKIIC